MKAYDIPNSFYDKNLKTVFPRGNYVPKNDKEEKAVKKYIESKKSKVQKLIEKADAGDGSKKADAGNGSNKGSDAIAEQVKNITVE